MDDEDGTAFAFEPFRSSSLRLPDGIDYDVNGRPQLRVRHHHAPYEFADPIATGNATPPGEDRLFPEVSFANASELYPNISYGNRTEYPDYLYRHSPALTAVYCVAYFLVFVIGLIGNCLVVAVVLRAPRMRTVTNLFIVNLAIADILVIVLCIPATLLSNIFVREYIPRIHPTKPETDRSSPPRLKR
ncbi:UNVERIFIED_CONTAM: hypothetical protein PYX00_003177 [Menopon gallinae]|uniref:G-protein coupled receptors family 1 profile domain-containing protein n=1 Tax=Menopon gallinae TaxID=328185 RepID=A0AAW2HYV7_9NEOP